MRKQEPLSTAQEREIENFQAELDSFEKWIEREEGLADAEAKAIAGLALASANGDANALSEQRAHRTKRDEHREQAENLRALAEVVLQKMVSVKNGLATRIRIEAQERIARELSELPVIGQKIAAIAQPVAAIVEAFEEQIARITAETLPLVSGGDVKKVAAIQSRLRTVVERGLKAELAGAFGGCGIEILSIGTHEPRSFSDTVRPLLESLINGLGINNPPMDDKARFRCATNVRGLFGLNFNFGEQVTLPVGDASVQRLVDLGALERLPHNSIVKDEV
jgi:hypothetical protein